MSTTTLQLYRHHQHQQAAEALAPAPSQGFPWIKFIRLACIGFAVGYGAVAIVKALAAANAPRRKRLSSQPPRDTHNYSLKIEGETVYQGITKRPHKRASEHVRDGKIFDEMVLYKARPRHVAKILEATKLAQFRAKNGGKNPLYNRTMHG